MNLVADRLILWVPLLFSLTVHEFAHAWSAFRLGDDTAAREGRLTLDPLVHMDPIGTVLLPLMGVPFGWARPVPVNPVRFRRDVDMRTGMMLTAAAGPASNLALALLSAVVLAVVIRFAPSIVFSGGPIGRLLETMLSLNVILAVFNMLPVPPLDGSRVADRLMPASLRPAWERFVQLGPIALVFLIVAPIPLFDLPLRLAHDLVLWLIRVLG